MLDYPKCVGDMSDEACKAVWAETHPEEHAWRWWQQPKDQPLTRREQRAWARYVNRSWKPSRWDRYPTGSHSDEPFPDDPVLWALCKRREDVARRLLERKGKLSWEEGSLYAPWTLNWSPSLLKLILDLSPQVGELGCCREFILPDGTARVLVENTLMVAAAALDDLPAVELLLERDYSMGGHDAFCRGVVRALYEAKIEPFDKLGQRDEAKGKFPCLVNSSCIGSRYQRFHLFPVHPVSHIQKGPDGKGFVIEDPLKEWSEGREILNWTLNMNDAMAAACLCGNIRVLRRLLRHPPALKTLDFHKAIALLAAAAESEPLRACVQAVEEAVGMPIARFIGPSEVEFRDSDFFVDCLRRHDFCDGKGDYRFDFVEYMAENFEEENWMEEAVRFVPRERLFAALNKFLPPMPDPDWASHPDCPVQLPAGILKGENSPVPLMAAAGLRCTLDRNTVSQSHDGRALLKLLKYAELTGQPPSGRLSGAAQCILKWMCLDAQRLLAHRGDVPAPLFQDQRALDILRQENPCLILPFVHDLPFSRESRLFLLSVLPFGEDKEGSYTL